MVLILYFGNHYSPHPLRMRKVVSEAAQHLNSNIDSIINMLDQVTGCDL
jgi:hypothetical protein